MIKKGVFCGCREFDDCLPWLRVNRVKNIKFSIHQRAVMYRIHHTLWQNHINRVLKEDFGDELSEYIQAFPC